MTQNILKFVLLQIKLSGGLWLCLYSDRNISIYFYIFKTILFSFLGC